MRPPTFRTKRSGNGAGNAFPTALGAARLDPRDRVLQTVIDNDATSRSHAVAIPVHISPCQLRDEPVGELHQDDTASGRCDRTAAGPCRINENGPRPLQARGVVTLFKVLFSTQRKAADALRAQTTPSLRLTDRFLLEKGAPSVRRLRGAAQRTR